MNSKQVSIIVPCYKVEKYLPRCLESLVNQTLDNIEIICINDGSPDNCLKILEEYQERYPDKIVIIDKPNEGVWRGRFDGIAIAQGEYIGFLDSDDYAEPTFAEDLYMTAKSCNADISVCGFQRIDLESGKPISHEMCSPRNCISIPDNPGRLIELNGAPWNKFFKASILKNLRDLECPPPVLDDLIFHLLIYLDLQQHGKIAFCPKCLVNYVVRNDSIINTISPDKLIKGYDSFLEIKQIYLENNASHELLQALDTIAFLHLGISMSFRLSCNNDVDLNYSIDQTTYFLDEYFPLWRSSPYMRLPYVLDQKGAFIKLFAAKKVYDAKGMGSFLALYRFMINNFPIDIKW